MDLLCGLRVPWLLEGGDIFEEEEVEGDECGDELSAESSGNFSNVGPIYGGRREQRPHGSPIIVVRDSTWLGRV